MIGHEIIAGVCFAIAIASLTIACLTKKLSSQKAFAIVLAISLAVGITSGIAGLVMEKQARQELEVAKYKKYYLEEVAYDYLEDADKEFVGNVMTEVLSVYDWAINANAQNEKYGIFSKYWFVKITILNGPSTTGP